MRKVPIGGPPCTGKVPDGGLADGAPVWEKLHFVVLVLDLAFATLATDRNFLANQPAHRSDLFLLASGAQKSPILLHPMVIG